jgi:hypothetical protein
MKIGRKFVKIVIFLQEWYVGMFKKMENIVITNVEQLVVNRSRVVK